MQPILAATNVAGVVVVFIIGVAFLALGVAILKNSGNVGSNYHRAMMGSRMPGVGFYENFRTFQVLIGGGSVLFGTFALIVVAVAVV